MDGMKWNGHSDLIFEVYTDCDWKCPSTLSGCEDLQTCLQLKLWLLLNLFSFGPHSHNMPLISHFCCVLLLCNSILSAQQQQKLWVSAAEKSVKQDVYLCRSLDPALLSRGSTPNDREEKVITIFRLQLLQKPMHKAALDCETAAHIGLFLTPVWFLKIVRCCRYTSQIYNTHWLFFSVSSSQIGSITTVHGWGTVWARGTTDTSTCSPCRSRCSPFISSPLTSSMSSCVSIRCSINGCVT